MKKGNELDSQVDSVIYSGIRAKWCGFDIGQKTLKCLLTNKDVIKNTKLGKCVLGHFGAKSVDEIVDAVYSGGK